MRDRPAASGSKGDAVRGRATRLMSVGAIIWYISHVRLCCPRLEEAMRPESRREQVLTQPVGNELVIYDERTHDAHHLSPTAAQVWRLADGERDVPDLASALRESIDQSPEYDAATLDEADSLELVRLALVELDRAGLLARALPDLAVLGEPISRRRMLGVTRALLPVVASLVAPTPAMALSCSATLNGPFNVISNGGPITVTITTSCAWLMTSLEGYITPTIATGTGTGIRELQCGRELERDVPDGQD